MIILLVKVGHGTSGQLKAGTDVTGIFSQEIIDDLLNHGMAKRVDGKPKSAWQKKPAAEVKQMESDPDNGGDDVVIVDGHLVGTVDDSGNVIELVHMKVSELRELAQDLEINGFESMKKAQLVEAIQAEKVGIAPEQDDAQ